MKTIRKKEQNDIVSIIQNNGISIDSFERTESDYSLSLEFNNSGLKFTFGMSPTDYRQFVYTYTIYSPDRKVYPNTNKYYLLVDILSNFDKWLKKQVLPYIEELEFSDPWKTQNQFKNEFYPDSVDLDFTTDQIQILDQKLTQLPDALVEQLEKLGVNIQESNSRIEELNDGISDIKELLKTNKTKKFIRTVVVGLLTGFVNDLITDPIVQNSVFEFFSNYFSNWHYLPPINPLP